MVAFESLSGIMKMTTLSIKLFIFAAISTCVVCEDLRISVRDKWMVDSYGRIRIFHGFNSVMKSFPWYDEQILNETRIKLFQEWGFNAVRLGVMWKGLEPERDHYNETYLTVLEQAVQLLKSRGLYSLLDAHQDVFSSDSNICPQSFCYEGIPNWVSAKFDPPFFTYPWPFRRISDEEWALSYLSLAVSNAFEQFYANKDGVFDQFAKFWLKVATKFKDEKSILGYELLNEPWTGDFFKNPDRLLPSVAGRKYLLPAYDRLFAEISSVDNHTNIFYEPVTWAVYTTFRGFKPGFGHLPGGKSSAHRAVLSYHYYCWPLQNRDMTAPYNRYLRFFCDDVVGASVMPTVLEDLRETKGSLFLTEFGLCAPDGDPASMNTIECSFVLEQADKYLQSWAYWDSVFFLPSGQVNTHVVEAFARAYPQATAGVPQLFHFDPVSKLFEFTFLNDPSINAPTLVFIPRIHYPHGIDVIISPADVTYRHDETSSILSIDNFPIQMNVSISVRPKPQGWRRK